jgi:hypothetical protein
MGNSHFSPQKTGERLLAMLNGAAQLVIVAPFIKTAALRRIVDALAGGAELTVYTRWRPEEVAAGVSDLEVLDLVEASGGTVYLHPLVHAKAYVVSDRALVGSSNVTFTGLGWAGVSSIENLHEVPRADPMLSALLNTLAAASSRATAAIQQDVSQNASNLKQRQLTWEIPDQYLEGAVSAFWVPRFNVPESVWAAYKGEREKAVQDLVLRDLSALGMPLGIDDEQTFRSLVGLALAQGFTGRLIQECAGLNAVDAADRLRSLLLEAGAPMPAGSLGERYQAFARWVAYFVPHRTLRASGYSIV